MRLVLSEDRIMLAISYVSLRCGIPRSRTRGGHLTAAWSTSGTTQTGADSWTMKRCRKSKNGCRGSAREEETKEVIGCKGHAECISCEEGGGEGGNEAEMTWATASSFNSRSCSSPLQAGQGVFPELSPSDRQNTVIELSWNALAQ